MRKIRLFSACLFAIASLASTAFGEIRFLDQQNLNTEALTASPSSVFSQSFIPSMAYLDTFEVILFVSGAESVALQLSLFQGTGVGGPSQRTTGFVTVSPAGGPIPVTFRFWKPVAVRPGTIYTFAIRNFESVKFSAQYGSDTYAGGNMFDSYYIYPDRDLYFREGLSASELSVTRTSDQRIQLQGSAPPNTSVTILASPDSSPTSFAAVAYVSSDASGTWSYVDAPAANVSRRFYLAGWP